MRAQDAHGRGPTGPPGVRRRGTRRRRVRLGLWAVAVLVAGASAAIVGCDDDEGARTAPPRTFALRPDGTGDAATIAAAIEAARDGDVIELADGIYRGEGNRDLDLLRKAITIRSASGDPTACVIDCEGDSAVARRGFHLHRGEGPATELSGFTIRAAYTDGFGGAVRCEHGSSPTLRNLVLTQCRALAGGGLCCTGGSNPRVVACEIADNRATYGGAVYCSGASPTFEACRFTGNRASLGGAIHAMLIEDVPLELQDCLFDGNYGSTGGAALLQQSELSADATVFAHNVADYGGAIFAAESSPVFSHCTFHHNTSRVGGAFHGQDASTPRFTSCTFCWEHAENSGAALHLTEGCLPTLQATLIVFCTGSEAVWSSGAGSTPQFECCDIFGNEWGDWVDLIAEQYALNQNLSVDPRFCDPENNDFRIPEDSPCSADSTGCGPIGAGTVGCGSAR